MPELPEVETVRRGLVPLLAGRALRRVLVRRPDLRFPLPPGFAAALTGRRVTAVERRAKYLLIRLDDGVVWIAHLGMSGRFVADPEAGAPAPGDHDHVLVDTDAGWTIRFRDPRRFGFMDLWPAGRIDDHPMLARLGPEPLSAAFGPAFLEERLSGRRVAVKSAILDQGVVAGMGNIYACESLFRARLSPVRLAGAVPASAIRRLVAAIRSVLEEAIAAGGSTLRDHRQPSGEVGTFQDGFAVYDRAGTACPNCTCDVGRTGGIQRIVQGGRATFYCPRRQR